MEGSSLAAELERHRSIDRELNELASVVASEHDLLGLRDVVLQARSDAYTLGMNLGAAVAARWALRRIREFISDPGQSFSSFLEEMTGEINEMVGEL